MSSATPRLKALLSRLRTHCETRRGSKTELARWLGVRPHMISEWLSGKQPGGEYALGILEWLEEQTEDIQSEPFRHEITCAWSQEEGEFIARVRALRHCLAYGRTAEKAVKEARIAAEAMLAVQAAQGKPIPAPDSLLERLKALAPVIKLAAVAKASGMSAQTLASKMKRGTPLTAEEEQRLGCVLHAHGVPA